MKIYKKDKSIIFEIPMYSKRQNPYMEGEYVGEYPTLTGIIDKDEYGNEELGFARTIDMAYKDKPDQWTDIVIHYWGDKRDFVELCRKLEIAVFEYSTCAHCGKSIYGCHTVDKNGKSICGECEVKLEK